MLLHEESHCKVIVIRHGVVDDVAKFISVDFNTTSKQLALKMRDLVGEGVNGITLLPNNVAKLLLEARDLSIASWKIALLKALNGNDPRTRGIVVDNKVEWCALNSGDDQVEDGSINSNKKGGKRVCIGCSSGRS